MTSRIQGLCLEIFAHLPDDVRRTAEEKYRIWTQDCFHSSLHFQPVHGDIWSMRINESYRALARRTGATFTWFWLGNHGEYVALRG